MEVNNPTNRSFGIYVLNLRPPYNLDLIDGRTVPKS